MNLKRIIREEIEDDFDWIRNVPSPEINDNNKYMVLVNILGVNEVFGDVTGFDDPNSGFEEILWDYWGLDIFKLDNGETWAVGTQDDFDRAIYDYFYDLPDSVGVENIYDVESYLTMSHGMMESFASDMAYNYIQDHGDEDIVAESSFTEEWDELLEKIGEVESEYYNTDDEDTEKELKDTLKELNKSKNYIIDKARDEVQDNVHNEWFDCLDDSPYDCLVRNHGFYDSVNSLIDSGIVIFDNAKFALEMSDQSDYSELARYDGELHIDSGYIAVRID